MLNFLDNKILKSIKYGKVNWDFLLLFVGVCLFNWPFLSKEFFPIHDTLEVFTFFHYFYSEWFIRGEIPQWFPHMTYGVPTNFYQFRNITPIYYVFMFLGKIFHIQDAIFLFKISVIGEQSIFLLGMYKLSNYLFKKRSTVFIVCLAAIGSVIWHSAINFNFRLYAMFPLVAYILFLFFEQGKQGYLWLAGIICLIGGMGVTIYFFGLWIFLYLLLSMMLFLKNKQALKGAFSVSRRNVSFFIVFIVIAVSFVFYLKGSIHFLTLVSKERQTSGANTLETFLAYGRLPEVKTLLENLISPSADMKIGVPFDNTLYFGLISVFFLIWSFVRVRKSNFYIFLGLAVTLIWLSFGGVFSSIVYRFPSVAYYRHIGHVYSLVKILLIICVGFGVENFHETPFRKKIWITGLVVLILLFVFDVFMNRGGELHPS